MNFRYGNFNDNKKNTNINRHSLLSFKFTDERESEMSVRQPWHYPSVGESQVGRITANKTPRIKLRTVGVKSPVFKIPCWVHQISITLQLW